MTAPGWHHAPGDPAGTRRWWDGYAWTGQIQAPPPAPRSPRKPAPIVHRVLARAADFFLVALMTSMLHRIWAPRVLDAEAYDATGLIRLDEFMPVTSNASLLLVTVLVAILWELYWLLFEGATPGKQLLGLYVHDPTSLRGRVELVPALKRGAHRVVAVIPYGWVAIAALSVASLALMLEDRATRRSVMDRFANTTVHRLPPGSPRFTPWLQVWLTATVVFRIAASMVN